MRLTKITDTLWVNAERVIAVEERTIDNGRGAHTYTEVTLETMTRWKLDVPLDQVVTKLDNWAKPTELINEDLR